MIPVDPVGKVLRVKIIRKAGHYQKLEVSNAASSFPLA